jgi:D-alanyl-D-alanine carboxypeptidase
MRVFLYSFMLLPFLSNSQSLHHSADSVRITRGIPGMVYAVFSSDSILELGAVGYKTYRTKDTLRVTDRFDIGTNTAAFTSYIAARMVEEGKIKWTTKLLDIYPERKKKAFPVYQDITLSALLSNRTRVPRFSTMEEWNHVPIFDGPNLSARRKSFTFYMLEQKPGPYNPSPNPVSFSVAGYIMAASMLEKAAGKKWENLVTEYLDKPLKISIKYGWPNLEDSTATSGHWNPGDYFRAEDHHTWVRLSPILNPANDINITLVDYIKFMQENLRGLLGKKAHLSQQSFEYLHYGLLDYAMGWNNGVLENVSYSFHEGISLLFDCRAAVLKEKDIGIIVMCNSSDKDARGAVLNFLRILEVYALER